MRRRYFERYFWARTVSAVGDAMLPVALTAAVLEQGYGATGVGLVLGAHLLPWVLLMLFTGVIADRTGPRRLMVSADWMRALVQGVLALALVTGRPHLWLIIGLQLVYGVGTALFQPGVASVVPLIADDVQRANGRLQSAESITGIIGPAAAGLLLAIFEAGTVVAFDAATFVVSAVLISLVRLERTPLGVPREPFLREMAVGWREFVRRPWLWPVILVFCLFGIFVFGPFYVLSAAIVTERSGSTAYGVMLALWGIGAAGGSWLAGRARPRHPLRWALAALCLIVPAFAVLAVDAPMAVIAAAFLVGGIGRAAWSVLWISTEQTHVPQEVLNRLYAYDVVGSIALLPVGRALAGPAANLIGFQQAMLLSGTLAALGTAAMLAVPAVRKLPAEPAAGTDAEPRSPVTTPAPADPAGPLPSPEASTR